MDLPSLEEYKQKENLKGDPNLDDQMRLIGNFLRFINPINNFRYR